MAATVKRVLIVEDEKPLSHALQLKLQSVGFETQVANDGQEGLNFVLTGKFDVMLLDVMMPGLDGFQVLEKMQEMPKKPVVFVLSNLSQPVDEEHIKQLGAKKYFIKADTPLATIVEEIQKA